MSNAMNNLCHNRPFHEPLLWSAAFTPLQLWKLATLRVAKRHKCRAPVHGPDARPILAVEAPHEPTFPRRTNFCCICNKSSSGLVRGFKVRSFAWGNSHPDPLPQERENHPRSLTCNCDRIGRMVFRRPESVHKLFPLPGGEGQGEGERKY
jgi:hypothetical protein